MIAHLKESDPQTTLRRRRLTRARRAAAAALLEPNRPNEPAVAPLAAWKSWLFAGWIVLCAAVFFAHTAGLID